MAQKKITAPEPVQDQEQEQSPAKVELPKGGLRALVVKISLLEMRISKLEERLN